MGCDGSWHVCAGLFDHFKICQYYGQSPEPKSQQLQRQAAEVQQVGANLNTTTLLACSGQGSVDTSDRCPCRMITGTGA